MRIALLALALLPSAAFGITILEPSATLYWVQFASNVIVWSFNSGDLSTVDIVLSNVDNRTLNGNFSIARSVAISQQSLVVTNVTLRVGTGYRVLFLDTTDTQVVATSSEFEVKSPGTSPAPTANPSSSAAQGTGTSGNGTASGSSASSTASSATSSKSNAALGLAFDARGLLSACGVVALGALSL